MKIPENEQIIGKVFEEIAREEGEMISTAQELVRIPSVVGSELQAQKFIEARLKEIGLKVETFEARLEEVRQHETYVPVSYTYANRPNVVGILEGSSRFRSLILN